MNGIGLVSTGGILAGLFQGDIRVTGDVYLTGGDCAEQFEISAVGQSEPGTVMVISSSGKTLEPSCRPYDTKVAGVISGAGDCRPGIVLDKQISDAKRADIALIGRVYCKVDADAAPITIT
ncbi:hypothetical protein ABIA39_000002 [Nocardia sp. GAS34]|uniref:hypothetical protein n=1 Tax=unclassified Nocardia TaxID=2637762 RepID=UPI003D230B1F